MIHIPNMASELLAETYQNGSLRGGPLGKRARFLPMLPMNSPKNEPPLKIGTPRLVGRVHLYHKPQVHCTLVLPGGAECFSFVVYGLAYPRNPSTNTKGSVLIQLEG